MSRGHCARCANPFTACGNPDCRCHGRERALQALRDKQMEERLWAAWRNGQ